MAIKTMVKNTGNNTQNDYLTSVDIKNRIIYIKKLRK